MNIFKKRRSVRQFSNKLISKKHLVKILDAGFYAPSPKNRKPWEYIVLDSTEKKDYLSDILEKVILEKISLQPEREDIRMALETVSTIRNAAVIVFVCYKTGTINWHDDGVVWPINATDIESVELQSIGASVENMLLMATMLGIDSLWCGDVLYAYNEVVDFLKVEYPVLSAICFGYKAGKISRRKKACMEKNYRFFR